MKVATDEEIQVALTALWEAGRVDVELVAAAGDAVVALRRAGFEIVRSA